MITIKTKSVTPIAVRFADMVPGKLYRFSYDNPIGSTGSGAVTGVAGINEAGRKAFTILHVTPATDRGITCEDKVGNVWVGRSFETRSMDFVLADDVTITISNGS